MTMQTMHHAFPSPMNMANELQHWRTRHQDLLGFHGGLRFERYIPTLEFGYSTFPPDYAADQVASLSMVCCRYKDRVAASDRIDWCEARLLVSAVWARLDNGDAPVNAPAHDYGVCVRVSKPRSRTKFS